MKQTTGGVATPIALICINKSRLKVYHKEKTPTYYLQKGQEFQIELFNPTSETVLAKVELNGNLISQGGLVLRPGERIFLERYLDVAKKFMFDTYEVSNTEEVKKAIEDNGDIKVQFYRESKPNYFYGSNTTYVTTPCTFTIYNQSNPSIRTYSTNSVGNTLNLTGGISSSSSINTVNYNSNVAGSSAEYSSNVTMDTLSFSDEIASIKSLKAKSKTIETGRVEAGSSSNQKFEYVDKKFDFYAFHTVEYKLLPVSQKINTSEDINIKRYCHNCGAKQKPEFKFCPSCGTRA